MKKDWTKEQLEKHYIGKMHATTVSVNITLKGKQKILDMSELENIIYNAKLLSQDECDCRSKFGNCIEPFDGCLGIDDHAQECIDKWGSKRISAQEALAAMKRTYEAGFVHMAYVFKGKDKIERICSCCSCCCHSLSAALRFGYSDHIFSSDFIAHQDLEKCNGCGVCIDRCQFRARKLVGDKLIYLMEECFGCGLCIGPCKNDAITMERRR